MPLEPGATNGTGNDMVEGQDQRKTKRYNAKREKVIDIAVELFSRQGYNGTGVQDIGDVAGLARGALYYYIGSKENLLAEIHDRVIDPLLAEAEVISTLEVSVLSRLRLLSESLLWQILNRPEHVWVFLHEYRQLQGQAREDFRVKRRAVEKYIQDVLEQGRDEGLLRLEDPRLTTLAFLNLHNYTYQWQAGRKDLEVESLAAFYCDLFIRGVVSGGEAPAQPWAELAAGRAMLEKMRAEA